VWQNKFLDGKYENAFVSYFMTLLYESTERNDLQNDKGNSEREREKMWIESMIMHFATSSTSNRTSSKLFFPRILIDNLVEMMKLSTNSEDFDPIIAFLESDDVSRDVYLDWVLDNKNIHDYFRYIEKDTVSSVTIEKEKPILTEMLNSIAEDCKFVDIFDFAPFDRDAFFVGKPVAARELIQFILAIGNGLGYWLMEDVMPISKALETKARAEPIKLRMENIGIAIFPCGDFGAQRDGDTTINASLRIYSSSSHKKTVPCLMAASGIARASNWFAFNLFSSFQSEENRRPLQEGEVLDCMKKKLLQLSKSKKKPKPPQYETSRKEEHLAPSIYLNSDDPNAKPTLFISMTLNIPLYITDEEEFTEAVKKVKEFFQQKQQDDGSKPKDVPKNIVKIYKNAVVDVMLPIEGTGAKSKPASFALQRLSHSICHTVSDEIRKHYFEPFSNVFGKEEAKEQVLNKSRGIIVKPENRLKPKQFDAKFVAFIFVLRGKEMGDAITMYTPKPLFLAVQIKHAEEYNDSKKQRIMLCDEFGVPQVDEEGRPMYLEESPATKPQANSEHSDADECLSLDDNILEGF
jgi:hypothetical protein